MSPREAPQASLVFSLSLHQNRDFRIHARAAHAFPYVRCQSTCVPFLSGREGGFTAKPLPPLERELRSSFSANGPCARCTLARRPPRPPCSHAACIPRPAHGRYAWPAHAERACCRRRHDIPACEALKPAHEAVRSRSMIESVRLHEHSHIQLHTTWPARTLLFSLRKTASVLAGPTWR